MASRGGAGRDRVRMGGGHCSGVVFRVVRIHRARGGRCQARGAPPSAPAQRPASNSQTKSTEPKEANRPETSQSLARVRAGVGAPCKGGDGAATRRCWGKRGGIRVCASPRDVVRRARAQARAHTTCALASWQLAGRRRRRLARGTRALRGARASGGGCESSLEDNDATGAGPGVPRAPLWAAAPPFSPLPRARPLAPCACATVRMCTL